MRRSSASRGPGLPEGTYVELVRSVFATVMSTTIMGLLFVVVSSFAVRRTGDSILGVLCVAGVLLSLLRVGLLLVYEKGAVREPGDGRTARIAERSFALAYWPI